VVGQDVATGATSVEHTERGAIDGGRLNQHQHQHIAPPRPQPSQNQPEQAVRRSKASIRPRPDGQLMGQGKHLEQEALTHRQGASHRSEGPGDVLYRAYHGPRYATINGFSRM